MEGMADSHSELMHCALGALSRSSSISSPNSSSLAAASASVSHGDTGGLFFNQLQQTASKSHSNNQTLFQQQAQCSPYSSPFQQSTLARDSSYQQACPLVQSHSHSRSVSQPSSFFQSLWQSPLFDPGSSFPFHEGIMRTKDDAASASPSSESSYRAAPGCEVSRSEHETSPAVSGHSIPPLPPLSPFPNNYQSAMKKNSTDLNQSPSSRVMRKGHRRSHSEVPLGILAGQECFSGRPIPFAQLEGSIDELPLQTLNRSKSNSGKDLNRVSGRMVMEALGERDGEGVDDVFSTYINVDKIESRHNLGVVDGLDQAGTTQFFKKRGISRALLGAEYEKVSSPRLDKAQSFQELSVSDKEESEKEEDSFMGDSNEMVVEDSLQKAQSTNGRACHSGHQRSASMDYVLHSSIEGDEGQRSNGAPSSRHLLHHHSLLIDGSLDTKLNFSKAEIDGAEMKNIMADEKLTEIALMDPIRAKRILANRQSAARSKERKVRYISELERKVQTLQTEATTLSAQLTLMQRDSTGLTNENNELKLRLQSMEQQSQLREALHEALREEVQRLKLTTGQIPGQVLNHQFCQVPHQTSQLASQQVEQQHLQPQFQEQCVASSSSSLHQSSAQMQN